MPLATNVSTVIHLSLAEAAHDPSALFGDNTFLRGYLIAYLFWLGISLGSLGLTWLHNLTGGRWGKAVRLELTAAAQTIPFFALAVIPLLLNMHGLFEWSHAERMASDHLLQKKAFWLNTPFFIARTIFCFCVWIGLSAFITKLRRKAQAEPTFQNEHALRFFSGQAVLAFGITVTIMAFDFAMSLEPHWYSGIYGVIFIFGQALVSLGFSTFVASIRNPSADPAPFAARHLGNLMLGFTMLWTYVSLSQFLIIWMADLPEENIYYLNRMGGNWLWLALTLGFFHFAFPFLTLFNGAVKDSRRLIGMVALWQVVMRWFDIVWCVEPAFSAYNSANVTRHLIVTAAFGGVWLCLFLWRRTALKNEFPYIPPAKTEGH